MPRPRVSYSAARAAIDSGQATAEDIAANFDLVMDGPSVADQARASMERRTSGGDLPPGYENLDRRSFGSGVKDALIPSWEGAKQLARTAAAPFAPTPENLRAFGETAMNVGKAQGHQAREAFDTSRSAFDDLRHGEIGSAASKYMETGGHVTAAALPLVGPAAAEAGEDYKKGDIARFLGKSTALVGSMLVPAAIAKGVDAAAPSVGGRLAASAERAMTAPPVRQAGFIQPAAASGAPSTSLMENLERIAAASPNAPTLTGIIKAQGPKIAKGLVVAAAGRAIPGGSMMIEALGGGGAGAAALKALYDLPKTAAFKAASVTAKTQFAKALTTGQMADAVTIGGRIVAGETARNLQPEPQKVPPDAAASPDAKRITPGQEWPTDANAKDENYDLLVRTNPASLLPDRFANARSVRWSTPIRPGLLGTDQEGNEFIGQYGQPYPEAYPAEGGQPEANFYGLRYNPGREGPLGGKDYKPFNNIFMSKQAGSGRGDSAEAPVHELYHAIWYKDLSDDERQDFMAHRAATVQEIQQRLGAAGIRSEEDIRDPQKKAAMDAIIAQYPKAITVYQAQPRESFAEMGGQYMANPSAFKRDYPQWYEYYRRLNGGKEYIQKHPR